jgi:hypothetical protein
LPSAPLAGWAISWLLVKVGETISRPFGDERHPRS